jgi:hypothetical protein
MGLLRRESLHPNRRAAHRRAQRDRRAGGGAKLPEALAEGSPEGPDA